MDFPIIDLMDEDACYAELIRWLHPEGLACPRCHRADRMRVHRSHRAPACDYRCGHCHRIFNAFTGTILHGTKRRPRELVPSVRGFAQGVPTERHRRIRRGIAKWLWREGHGRPQPVPKPLVPQPGASQALGVGEGGRIVAPEVRLDPIVDGSGVAPDRVGDVAYRPSPIDFEDCQGAAIGPGITGSPQLSPQSAALPGVHPETVHGGPPTGGACNHGLNGARDFPPNPRAIVIHLGGHHGQPRRNV
jgi:hypothetical protein